MHGVTASALDELISASNNLEPGTNNLEPTGALPRRSACKRFWFEAHPLPTASRLLNYGAAGLGSRSAANIVAWMPLAH